MKHRIRPSFEVDGHIDFEGNPHYGPYRLTNVHDESLCQGRCCVIHYPSDHHMRDYPLIWNSLETQMERLCEHDFTHPDPDDLLYWINIANMPWKAEHICCPHDCCTPPKETK